MGYTGTHLHKTVEPTAPGPWSGPAIGVEADLDQFWIELLTFISAKSKRLERARTVAVHQNVRSFQELEKPFAVIGVTQIKPRTALADGHLGDDPWLIPIWRIDTPNICATVGQKSRRDRARKNPRQ